MLWTLVDPANLKWGWPTLQSGCLAKTLLCTIFGLILDMPASRLGQEIFPDLDKACQAFSTDDPSLCTVAVFSPDGAQDPNDSTRNKLRLTNELDLWQALCLCSAPDPNYSTLLEGALSS